MINPFEVIDKRLENIETLLLDLKYQSTESQQPAEPQKKYAYSIQEGADEFHVSTVTFQAWKNKGLVKYIQQGRKLIIDIPGTMELLANKKGLKKN